MAELLKNMFNQQSLSEVANAIQLVYPPFKTQAFLASTMDETWDELGLKARNRKITLNLGTYLPLEYREAVKILEKALQGFSFAYFFPDFINLYGQGDVDWDFSVSALARTTEYWTAEFAVRPFIVKNQTRMMKEMDLWADNPNEHIRRLASEGCRPQLPWGKALVSFKEDPTPILPILEKLKTDPSLYVRKSVANNLNDMSKTHPDLVITIAKNWYGKNKDTDWIVTHGCRTLLKKGNREVLSLLGYGDMTSLTVKDFSLQRNSIAIGEDATFSFLLSAKTETKARLEYAIDYVKTNGKRSRKIFQLSKRSLQENEERFYTKKHSFRDTNSRKHHSGQHLITLIVNGIEKATAELELTP